jgi:hypothetical protein
VASSCGAWTRRSISGDFRKRVQVRRTCPRDISGWVQVRRTCPRDFSRRSLLVAATAMLLFLPGRLPGEDRFRAELFGGSAWSVPSTLRIDQSGEERLAFRAHWDTRPFHDAPYYAARVALWSGRHGWELQLLHHKIYLDDPPPEIDSFQVSHGWNLLSIQRASRGRSFEWRVGAGAVIAHAEGRVRGRDVETDGGLFEGGYHLSGAGVLAGAGKSFPISHRFFAKVEAQATYSRVRVPIHMGRARTSNVAFHALFGFGFGI